MGKAVPKSIKSRVEILLEEFPKLFGTDFDKNKQALNELDFNLNIPFTSSYLLSNLILFVYLKRRWEKACFGGKE